MRFYSRDLRPGKLENFILFMKIIVNTQIYYKAFRPIIRMLNQTKFYCFKMVGSVLGDLFRLSGEGGSLDYKDNPN